MGREAEAARPPGLLGPRRRPSLLLSARALPVPAHAASPSASALRKPSFSSASSAPVHSPPVRAYRSSPGSALFGPASSSAVSSPSSFSSSYSSSLWQRESPSGAGDFHRRLRRAELTDETQGDDARGFESEESLSEDAHSHSPGAESEEDDSEGEGRLASGEDQEDAVYISEEDLSFSGSDAEVDRSHTSDAYEEEDECVVGSVAPPPGIRIVESAVHANSSPAPSRLGEAKQRALDLKSFASKHVTRSASAYDTTKAVSSSHHASAAALTRLPGGEPPSRRGARCSSLSESLSSSSLSSPSSASSEAFPSPSSACNSRASPPSASPRVKPLRSTPQPFLTSACMEFPFGSVAAASIPSSPSSQSSRASSLLMFPSSSSFAAAPRSLRPSWCASLASQQDALSAPRRPRVRFVDASTHAADASEDAKAASEFATLPAARNRASAGERNERAESSRASSPDAKPKSPVGRAREESTGRLSRLLSREKKSDASGGKVTAADAGKDAKSEVEDDASAPLKASDSKRNRRSLSSKAMKDLLRRTLSLGKNKVKNEGDAEKEDTTWRAKSGKEEDKKEIANKGALESEHSALPPEPRREDKSLERLQSDKKDEHKNEVTQPKAKADWGAPQGGEAGKKEDSAPTTKKKRQKSTAIGDIGVQKAENDDAVKHGIAGETEKQGVAKEGDKLRHKCQQDEAKASGNVAANEGGMPRQKCREDEAKASGNVAANEGGMPRQKCREDEAKASGNVAANEGGMPRQKCREDEAKASGNVAANEGGMPRQKCREDEAKASGNVAANEGGMPRQKYREDEAEASGIVAANEGGMPRQKCREDEAEASGNVAANEGGMPRQKCREDEAKASGNVAANEGGMRRQKCREDEAKASGNVAANEGGMPRQKCREDEAKASGNVAANEGGMPRQKCREDEAEASGNVAANEGGMPRQKCREDEAKALGNVAANEGGMPRQKCREDEAKASGNMAANEGGMPRQKCREDEAKASGNVAANEGGMRRQKCREDEAKASGNVAANEGGMPRQKCREDEAKASGNVAANEGGMPRQKCREDEAEASGNVAANEGGMPRQKCREDETKASGSVAANEGGMPRQKCREDEAKASGSVAANEGGMPRQKCREDEAKASGNVAANEGGMPRQKCREDEAEASGNVAANEGGMPRQKCREDEAKASGSVAANEGGMPRQKCREDEAEASGNVAANEGGMPRQKCREDEAKASGNVAANEGGMPRQKCREDEAKASGNVAANEGGMPRQKCREDEAKASGNVAANEGGMPRQKCREDEAKASGNVAANEGGMPRQKCREDEAKASGSVAANEGETLGVASPVDHAKEGQKAMEGDYQPRQAIVVRNTTQGGGEGDGDAGNPAGNQNRKPSRGEWSSNFLGANRDVAETKESSIQKGGNEENKEPEDEDDYEAEVDILSQVEEISRKERHRERREMWLHEELESATQVALSLRIASITNLQTCGSYSRGEGRALPKRVRGGVTNAPGAYGLAPSFSICVVAWLPEEDPLEVLGISQGVSWLPGWGLRVSTAVHTRPSVKSGALGLDDADVQQVLTVALSAEESLWHQRMLALEKGEAVPALRSAPHRNRFNLRETCGSPTFERKLGVALELSPFVLLSVVHIHQQLAHGATPTWSPDRPAEPGISTDNEVGGGRTVVYPATPPVTVVGTAVLPLAKLNREKGEQVDRHRILLMDINDAPPVAVHADGRLTYLQACRIFRHDVVREMTALYRESLKRLEPVSLLRLLDLFASRLCPVGEVFLTMNNLAPLSQRFHCLLGPRWRDSVELGDDAKTACDDSEAARDSEHFRSYPAANAVWVEVRRVVNVPVSTLSFREICDAEISVVALWEGEKGCAEIFRRKSRKIEAASKCRVQPLRFSAIERISREEDSLLSCYVGGQVCLPVYPGLDPVLTLYLCLNGQPYATLQTPLNLGAYSPAKPVPAVDRCKSAAGRGGDPRHALRRWHATARTAPRRDAEKKDDAEDEKDAIPDWHGDDAAKETLLPSRLSAHDRGLLLFKSYRLASYRDERDDDDYVFLSNVHFGQIELRMFPSPADGLFMTASEFSLLSIKGRLASAEYAGSWQNCANQFGGPMLGPFGQWTAFGDDFEPRAAASSESSTPLETEGDADSAAQGGARSLAARGSRPISAFFSPAPVHLQPTPDAVWSSAAAPELALEASPDDSPTTPLPLAPPSLVAPVTSPRGRGPVAAAQCVALGAGLSVGQAGAWNVFEVKLKNARGESVVGADGELSLRFAPLGEPSVSFAADSSARPAERQGGGNVAANLRTCSAPEWGVEKKDGEAICTVKYRHARTGYLLMYVTYDGLEISGSPFEIHIVSGKAAPGACRVSGLAAKICFASPSPHLELPFINVDDALRLQRQQRLEEGWKRSARGAKDPNVELNSYINQLTVVVCDELGNCMRTGGHCVTARGAQGAKILQVLDEGNGSYRIDYVVYLPKQLLQQVDLETLEKLDKRAWTTLHEADVAVPGLVEEYEALRALELPIFTEALIEVLLNEKPIFGCPFKARVCNFAEVYNAYREIDSHSLLGGQVSRFERLLNEGEYAEAADLLWAVESATDEKELKAEIVRVLETLVQRQLELEDAKRRERAGARLDALVGETSKEREQKRRAEIQQIRGQWEDIQLLRELLGRLTKNCSERESLIQHFTFAMMERLHQTQAGNLRIMAEHHNLQRLEQENLIPLAQIMQSQYVTMFRQMTKELVRLVRGVETKQFVNLENLLQTYRRIGDQLRRLHRYHLASVLDEINDCVVEEIELQRLAHIARAKEEKIFAIEQEIAAKEKALEDEKQKHQEALKDVKPLNMTEVYELSTTKRQAGVQTEDALSLRQGIFGPLIVARATEQHVPKSSEVVAAVKKVWKSCNVYDIHTTIKRLLKSCPRLKHCIEEVFLHYAKVSTAHVRDLRVEGLPVGLPRPSFFRFCNDARLDRDLLADPTQLQDLFDKFSIEPDTGRIHADGFLRVVPLFLWLPCLRELAYLDLLHALCRENLEENRNPQSALRREHPSRVTAFHYFCRAHFLPLYQMLYNSDDFRISSRAFMDAELSGRAATAAGRVRVQKKWNLLAYSREKLPYDVFSMLSLEPMEHLFVFYSELSMKPALARSRDAPLFPTAASGSKQSRKTYDESAGAGQDCLGPATRQESAGIRIFASQASVEETSGAEHASESAWVSLGVFIQMWRELSVIPGFIDVDTALRIAQVTLGNAKAARGEDAEGSEETSSSDEEENETVGFRRLLSMPEIPHDAGSGKHRAGKPARKAEKGRLHFPNFVEALVNILCECTARSIIHDGDPSVSPMALEATAEEVKKKAFSLVHLLGINDVSRILLLTKRPLRESPNIQESWAGHGGEDKRKGWGAARGVLLAQMLGKKK
ncbi:hypothetical protein BESB_037760 [Besnoitia besnoiti]|uniref:Uncharacterized protein n=1 Tax=Besnoitia besnoiti TaxID=94643 RepID=A0A2A9MFP3_BESBE|nr:hypothetical protein BESB_037760 [Besnoitia besnoiti]PFH37318.1 hypothetical protein BESB_037760 [Besnoitia besnoiti]